MNKRSSKPDEKRVLLTLILSFALILSACANKSEDDNDHDSHSSAHAPKNAKQLKEKDIFTSNKNNATISEDEMNKVLKKYLQVNSDILDNKYVMQHKLDRQSDSSTKITKSNPNN